MDLSHYTLQQSIGSYVNKWLKFALITIGGVSVILAILLYQNMRHKMTILVPPVMTHQMSLSVVRADESYLVQMGLFWLGLKLNISPDNVEQNHKILRTHIAPKAWGEIQQIFEQEAQAIKQGRIASVFYPTAQAVDLPNLTLKVTGKLEKRTGTRLVSEKEATFVICFLYHNGALQITDMYALEKG